MSERILGTVLLLLICGAYMFAVKDQPPSWDKNFRKMNSLALVITGIAIIVLWVLD